jgi:hypothetical protein
MFDLFSSSQDPSGVFPALAKHSDCIHAPLLLHTESCSAGKLRQQRLGPSRRRRAQNLPVVKWPECHFSRYRLWALNFEDSDTTSPGTGHHLRRVARTTPPGPELETSDQVEGGGPPQPHPSLLSGRG